MKLLRYGMLFVYKFGSAVALLCVLEKTLFFYASRMRIALSNTSIIGVLLLVRIACIFAQFYDGSEEQVEEIGEVGMYEEDLPEGLSGLSSSTDFSNVYSNEYFPAVAVASFTGPNIVGEFSFSQDTKGEVVATGAFHKGLKQDVKYKFSFYSGTSCEELGEVVVEHEFSSMHALYQGATAPIQEAIPDIHLTGEDGFIGTPWVLSDNKRSLACVVLKGPETE